MVITDAAGKTDFLALQSYLKNLQAKSLTYIVFDPGPGWSGPPGTPPD